MISRRSILGTAGALLAGGAAAQVTTLDLGRLSLEPRLDDAVAPGLSRGVLIRWGDRVTYDAPPWNPLSPDTDQAATQFGWDGRIAALLEPPPGSDDVPRLVLVATHPEVDPAHAFPGGRDLPAIASRMQGLSVLNMERQGGRWVLVDGGFHSRRLSSGMLARFGGPAALPPGLGLLPLGGGTATPWQTALLAEGDPWAWLIRLRGAESWAQDAARFGWVVELDPLDPQGIPVKRTALGRVLAGDVAAVLAADGRAVVYLTERRPGGFFYRFVSDAPATGRDTLNAGTLFVARAEGRGLAWLPLPQGAETAMSPRRAAERMGATPLDIPAGLAADPRRWRLFLACRGGGSRGSAGPDAMNPRPGTGPGHVLEILPEGDDHAAPRAAVRTLFVAGEAEEGGSYGFNRPSPGAAPRYPVSLAADAQGRLWIGTERSGRGAPALFACDTDGPGRGLPLPAYVLPRGAVPGGAVVTPDGSTLLLAVRHPGAEQGASFERPATRWPEFVAGRPPRSAIVALSQRAGGPVGG